MWTEETYLIMTPRHHDILETAIRLIDSIRRRINGIVEVWVAGEGTGVYVFIGESTADDEGILAERSKSAACHYEHQMKKHTPTTSH